MPIWLEVPMSISVALGANVKKDLPCVNVTKKLPASLGNWIINILHGYIIYLMQLLKFP